MELLVNSRSYKIYSHGDLREITEMRYCVMRGDITATSYLNICVADVVTYFKTTARIVS